jgi:hypothetical protein
MKCFTTIIGLFISFAIFCQNGDDSVNKVQAELVEILNIDSVTLEEYSTQALYKVEELGRYLSIIANKNNDSNKKDKAIDLAIKLFISPNKTIQISRIRQDGSTNVYQSTILDYLRKLKLLEYSNVKIAWTKINYVSKLTLGQDGFYHGVISIEQEFRGFMDNAIVYQDITRKNIEIILGTKPVYLDGRRTLTWDVLLGDTYVVETRNI